MAVSGSLSDSSAILVSGTYSVLTDDSVASISGSGEINLNSSRLTTGLDNSNTTFSGRLYGDGGLTKAGTGELTLSGSHEYDSYLGTTEVSNGILTVTGNAPTFANCASGASSNICPIPVSPSPSPTPCLSSSLFR